MIRRCRQPAGAWNSASGCPVAPPRQPRAIPDLIPDFRPFLMSVREKDPVVVVGAGIVGVCCALYLLRDGRRVIRSEEHTSELQSLMRISYAVFCLQKNN